MAALETQMQAKLVPRINEALSQRLEDATAPHMVERGEP